MVAISMALECRHTVRAILVRAHIIQHPVCVTDTAKQLATYRAY